jgi:hypothetical protein
MRIIGSDEATIDDAFEAARLMIEEGNTGHGVQLLRAPEIALVRGAIDQASYRTCAIRDLIKWSSSSSSASGSKPSPTGGLIGGQHAPTEDGEPEIGPWALPSTIIFLRLVNKVYW